LKDGNPNRRQQPEQQPQQPQQPEQTYRMTDTTTTTTPAIAIVNDAECIPQMQDPCQVPATAVKDMHVIFVQDVSGSMEDQRVSVANGINEIVGDLQKRYKSPCEYTASISMIQFSSHDFVQAGPAVPVHDVPRMNATDLLCNGMTAMWDATAVAIARMNADSAGVPATTYIFTDGDDNDSRKYNRSSVNEMIADNKKRNPMHSVLFIGSDPSAKRNAEGMGLDRVHSIHHDSANTPIAYEVCRRALGRCVSGDTQSTEFNDDDIVMSETPSHCDQHNQHNQPNQHNPCDFIDSQITDDEFVFASDDVLSICSS
jgi:uncharacterized protein YegL